MAENLSLVDESSFIIGNLFFLSCELLFLTSNLSLSHELHVIIYNWKPFVNIWLGNDWKTFPISWVIINDWKLFFLWHLTTFMTENLLSPLLELSFMHGKLLCLLYKLSFVMETFILYHLNYHLWLEIPMFITQIIIYDCRQLSGLLFMMGKLLSPSCELSIMTRNLSLSPILTFLTGNLLSLSLDLSFIIGNLYFPISWFIIYDWKLSFSTIWVIIYDWNSFCLYCLIFVYDWEPSSYSTWAIPDDRDTFFPIMCVIIYDWKPILYQLSYCLWLEIIYCNCLSCHLWWKSFFPIIWLFIYDWKPSFSITWVKIHGWKPLVFSHLSSHLWQGIVFLCLLHYQLWLETIFFYHLC